MDSKFPNDNPCERCSLKFRNRTVLNVHMRLVHKIEGKSMNTNDIVKFETGDEMSKKTVNKNKSFSENKRFECVICDYRFSNNFELI